VEWIRETQLGGEVMSVKPELAFDVCWEVYRGAREVLESKRGISASELEGHGEIFVETGLSSTAE
jgi:hypothetical protein